MGIFLVVQRLRLHASNIGGEGSIPGQGHAMQYSQKKTETIERKQNVYSGQLLETQLWAIAYTPAPTET